MSISSAHVILKVKLGLKVSSRCTLAFKTVSSTFFYEMEQEVRHFLGSLQPEFDLAFRMVTNSYGYMWIVFEGNRIEDLMAGLTAAGDIVAEKGCQYLIYNYRRNNSYPFVSADSKSRDRAGDEDDGRCGRRNAL